MSLTKAPETEKRDVFEDQLNIAKNEQTRENITNSIKQETNDHKIEIFNSQEPPIFRNILNTPTGDSLTKTLMNPYFENMYKGKNGNERLQAFINRLHNTLALTLYTNFEMKKGENPELDKLFDKTILLGIEMEILSSLAKNGTEKNQETIQTIKEGMEDITTIFSKVTTITSTFKNGNKIISAMNVLANNKKDILNALKQGKTAEAFNDPISFRNKYLNHPLREHAKETYKLTLKDFGIDLNTEINNKPLTQEQQAKIKEVVWNIPFNGRPETLNQIMNIAQKVDNAQIYQPQIQNKIFAGLDKISWTKRDVIGFLEGNTWLKNILNIIVFLLTGNKDGIDGLIRKRSAGKIEKNLTAKKEDQIQDIYAFYQNKHTTKTATTNKENPLETKDKKADENNLKTILGKRIPKNMEELFDIDMPLLHTALTERSDAEEFSAETLLAMGKQEFLKKETIKQGDKLITTYKIDPEKINDLNRNKEDLIDEYLRFITEDLATKESYLKSLKKADDNKENSPVDKMVFTIISALYVPENVVINGIRSEVFLPKKPKLAQEIIPETPSTEKENIREWEVIIWEPTTIPYNQQKKFNGKGQPSKTMGSKKDKQQRGKDTEKYV